MCRCGRSTARTGRAGSGSARRSARSRGCCCDRGAIGSRRRRAPGGPLLAVAHGGDVHLLIRTGLLAPTIAALAVRRARLAFVTSELRDRARAAVPGVLARWIDRHAIVQPMGVDLARFAAIPDPA